MFAEAIEEILKDRCTPAAVRSIEAGESPADLWNAIADAGFLELLTSEEEGGGGLSLSELFPILTTMGRHAIPVPLAQSIAARALLAGRAPVPSGMLTLAPAMRTLDDGKIVCPLVPFGAIADHLLAEDADSKLLVLSCADARRTPTGVHGSLAATLCWESTAGCVGVEQLPGTLSAFGAALHAALLTGAMQRVFDMTLQYANDRSQFGKTIGKFQAIQHQISVMAEHVVASSIATEAAFQGDNGIPALLLSAMAKSRTSEAATLLAASAHAVHGAIGITEEYDLQLFTRRLHEWRIAHGSEAYWNQVVGRAVLQSSQRSLADFVCTAST